MLKNKATPPTQRMDVHELMAHDLEFRQKQRLRQTKFKDAFFERPVEKTIQDRIIMLRQLSETYIPGKSINVRE